MDDKEAVKVSVLCITYNHKNFIQKCLDNFVCQKTNFKFEILVHDDCSSDGTAEIVKEYANKYPDLIIAMLEKENQYSKGVQIVDDLMLPKAKGKYIALCEGDDYWCNENKLQLQYDFMEQHPDVIACFGNTVCHDLDGKAEDKYYNNYQTQHFLTAREAIVTTNVHTSSYFFKRELLPRRTEFRKYSFGDYVMLTSALAKGKLAVLPTVMSVYNNNNHAGLTYKTYNEMPVAKKMQEIAYVNEYLIKFNELTNNVFKKETEERIMNMNCSMFDIELNLYKTKKEFYANRKQLKSKPIYKEILKSKKGWSRIKAIIKYNLPYFIWQRWIKAKI